MSTTSANRASCAWSRSRDSVILCTTSLEGIEGTCVEVLGVGGMGEKVDSRGGGVMCVLVGGGLPGGEIEVYA